MLTASLAAFEIRYQLRNPVFWVSVAIFLLLGFGLSASDNVSFGTPGSVHENSPYAVTFALALLGMFYLFVITSFVANAVVRDDVTGFGPIIRATPVGRTQFLAGRFLGGLTIAILGYMAVPLGIALGTIMPWVDPETVGPGGFATYAWPFLVIAIPNLILSSALLFSLATLTRSMLASYIGVLVLVMGYLATSIVLSADPSYQDAIARYEPMGTGAIAEVSRYWTAAEMNTRLIPLEGNLAFNRAFVLGLSALFLGLSWARFSMTERAPSRWRQRRLAKQAIKAAKAGSIAPRMLTAPVERSFGFGHALASFRVRVKTEVLLVVKSPGLIVLLLLSLGFATLNLVFSQTMFGTASYPLTANVVDTVSGSVTLFALIVAVFYGGELVWRERDVKMAEIIDATPVPAWTMFVPKILAIFTVLLAMSLTGMAAGVVYQLAKGAPSIDFGLYFISYVMPQSIDLLLLAVLAVFFQVLSPNKYLGWGLMLVWFVSRIFMSNLGYTNVLYSFGGGPGEPLSDMNGTGGFWVGGLIARAYWGCFGVLLLVFAHWAWPRGTVVAVVPRLKGIGQRMTLASGGVAVAAVAGMIGTGLVIHHNIKELNRFETSDEAEEWAADYERKYLKYESLPRPVVTDVAFDVAIYPDDRRMEVKGHYDLRNDSGVPITELHVRQGDDSVAFSRLDIAGASLANHDKRLAYRIYRFATPLALGATTRLDFTSQVWRRGFANREAATDLVDNGTFVNNRVFAPIIGMDQRGLLEDRTVRRRQGLPDELRMPRLEDTSAQGDSYVRSDWVNSRITISTAADQVPIAPGNKISDEVKGGRRVAVFQSPAPILNFFSVQSARYAVAEEQAGDVLLSVYHDPRHAWNVPAMLKAMKTSLGYYERNFGPYQFGYARIIEFPGYADFAQAFAGTMPYSESMGFAADVRDPESIDYVSYITAHEFGHQYWAHQVIGADMQGSTLLSETLAQYSALMVMKQLYGEDKIRRFLKFELDRYLDGRKGDPLPEQPLYRVENQQHIHYRKGSLVMYLLQHRLGEDAVNRALARLIARYKFKPAPYPRSLDLIAELRKEAKTPEDQALITDLFEKITIYDLKAKEAVSTKRADGKWVTRITIEAGKFTADGKGNERPASLAERIEVGVFTDRPGSGAFDKAAVLSMRRSPIRAGKQVVEVVTAKKPAFAGVDPYNFYIDRDSEDNLVPVT
ncbi:ABC transporter permease/M1 family aminopeptidase [Porphyrobacter sp. ULC335]|uniref:ABC transporter permease/M1 family aminopeptidase n=1 Tax=Porphyrobacter sp. ULC335 TaxID=2854260 RepID=UPI00221F1BC4|nr:M1 family aminopeptidase [Porphyrobacter sp. ULC335]UYV14356.1 aminopeptidase [Porphyrobacter sp. ULC335]